MIRLTAWRLHRWWQRIQRHRWLTRYAQAITWHSGYCPSIARDMALEALAADPGDLTRQDPTEAALRALGIREEDLA